VIFRDVCDHGVLVSKWKLVTLFYCVYCLKNFLENEGVSVGVQPVSRENEHVRRFSGDQVGVGSQVSEWTDEVDVHAGYSEWVFFGG